MAVLTNIQKVALVEALAGFMRPADVVVYMRDEYGVTIDIPQVVTYDPTKPSYKAGDDLRAIFDAARKNHIEDVISVPAANQGYRLRTLQALIDKSLKDGKVAQTAELLEQAAKEVGGVLTNERNVKLDRTTSPLSELTPEERRGMVADMLRDALDKHKQQNAATTDTAQ